MLGSMRPRGQLALLWASAALLGCASAGHYDVQVVFSDGVDASHVRFIELRVLEQCPTATAVLSGEAPSGETLTSVGLAQTVNPLPALGELDPGLYALYGRGFASDCTAVVAGCVSIEVAGKGGGTFQLTLEPTAEVPACAPEAVCEDGACVVDPGDACAPAPCGPGAYCTDLPDPAPVDASGRTCAALTECGVGQYQVSAPDRRTDRRCADCTVCGAGELELVPCADGDAPEDRICGPGDALCTLVAQQDGEATTAPLAAPSGTAPTMRVTDDSFAPYYGFVQFDVASGACEEGGSLPAGATIESVSLALTRTGGCSVCGLGHSLRRVVETWTEADVTAGSGPAVGGAVSATFDAPPVGSTVLVAGSDLQVDVEGMLADPTGDHGWRLEQSEPPGNGLSPYTWATRENPAAASRPRLLITYLP